MRHDQQGEANVSPSHVSEQDVLSVTGESEALDAVFRALADYRRRCACHYLARSDGPMRVEDLAELLAASVREKSRALLTADEVEKTRTELLRMHLPRLAEAGVVKYDGETVTLAGSPGVRVCLGAASSVDFG
ncbi:hypothetical protein NGM10_13245 [Halorussus salilacus]|uniref:DUF7344 domain-containing protein n=1 Tax=Halorussus salilacus TaxID=2953750 RepID=UPI00209D31C8|nr:hypothetical protein [Halorussus salilacus]USZ67687.1 hypothetical protein NGM10_13245 [Halorussus salilacus]